MFRNRQYFEEISLSLSIISQVIESKAKLNLTDDSKYIQGFICGMLNLVYGFDLVVLDSVQENFPGLDLGDVDREIGFQITATRTSKKIKDTIEICNKHECCHKYKNIWFC